MRPAPAEPLAVLHLDLDRFKGINDAFGTARSATGAAPCRPRLQERLASGDPIARLGSDEFVVLADGIRRADDATDLCRRLPEAFAEPFMIRRQEMHLSASIGITVYPSGRPQPRHSC